jgi:Cupin-like domain
MTMIDVEAAPAPGPLSPGARLLEIDPEVLARRYNRTPFLFGHRLAEHPLLQLESLVDLANRLPTDQVRQAKGSKPLSANIDESEATDRLTLAGILADMEHADRFVLLYHPERDPLYRELLDTVLDEMQPLSEAIDPGMRDRHAFIFIASPGAVTPYHMDREVNFLCQVRGTKVVSLWDQDDRSILSEEEIETLVVDWNRPRPPYRPEYDAKAMRFTLEAGMGVHQPMFAPHAVTCGGGDISIAIALTFRTRSLARRMMVHSVNHRLRQHGRLPTPYGSPVADGIKYQGMRAYRGLRSLAGR